MNIIWFLIAIILIIISNTSLKYYSQKKEKGFLFISTLLYIILVYCYSKIYEKENVSSGFIIVNVSALIGITILGFFLFNENMTNYKIAGIILSIVSIYLMRI